MLPLIAPSQLPSSDTCVRPREKRRDGMPWHGMAWSVARVPVKEDAMLSLSHPQRKTPHLSLSPAEEAQFTETQREGEGKSG